MQKHKDFMHSRETVAETQDEVWLPTSETEGSKTRWKFYVKRGK